MVNRFWRCTVTVKEESGTLLMYRAVPPVCTILCKEYQLSPRLSGIRTRGKFSLCLDGDVK